MPQPNDDLALPDSEAAYWAGYLDGEGCFRISGELPRIEVGSTHKPTLDALKATFGGEVYSGKRAVGTNTTRPQFRWQISGWPAMRVMRAVEKFSIEKKPQLVVLELYWAALMTKHEALVRLSNLKRARFQ